MKQPEEIRDIAKKHHIKTAGLSKIELIRKIQLSEGGSDCFANFRNGEFCQTGCLWHDDCFAAAVG